MARTKTENMAIYRLRKRIEKSVVPGTVRVEGYRDPETGQPFLSIECGFTVEGWTALEKLAALTDRTSQEIYEDACRRILAKVPVKQH